MLLFIASVKLKLLFSYLERCMSVDIDVVKIMHVHTYEKDKFIQSHTFCSSKFSHPSSLKFLPILGSNNNLFTGVLRILQV